MVKRQGDLWQEGLSIGEMFVRGRKERKLWAISEAIGIQRPRMNTRPDEKRKAGRNRRKKTDGHMMGDYGGGKWGRYLRAPDFYFKIMREFGNRFTRIGEVATIKFGIKSGCDAFFMPRNVSSEAP